MGDTTPPASETIVKDMPLPVAEPAPLGLIGIAVATLVLGLTEFDLYNGAKTLMIPWTLFLGATAQLIAGILDYKRKNIFGGTAFTAYALLWYTVSLTLTIATWGGVAIDMVHYGYGMIGFLVFSFIITAASLMTNKLMFTIVIALDLALIALIPNVLWGTPAWIVGVFLLITSALSFYGTAAVLLNTMAGTTVLPVGKPIWVPGKPRGS